MYHPTSPMTTTLTKVTVEKAISAIETAADEIPAEDFLSYSTILDVHLSHALESFTREEQTKLLHALENILKTHDELAKNIAWDLIAVLLPFLDAPPPTEGAAETAPGFQTDVLTEIASTCLFLAAYKGNSREVFLKILGALSDLSFSPSTAPSPLFEEEAEEREIPLTPTTPHKTPKEARENGYRKLRILIMLLTTIHGRITTAFPSRFLSQSLTTLLRTFTRSVEYLSKEDVEDIISRLLVFVDSVQPVKTKKQRRMTQPQLGPDGRPTLPPRTATSGSNISAVDISKLDINDDEDDEAREERLQKEERERQEQELQIRLLQSFLSHIVEVYIMRCPSNYASPPSQKIVKNEPTTPTGASPNRGINLHLASRFMNSNKLLPGGPIGLEKAAMTATPSLNLWKEVLDMAYQLSISTKELQELCCSAETEGEEADEPKTPVGALGTTPQYADEIPLSKNGSLILLASRIFEKESILSVKLRLFPEHRRIVHKYLTKGGGSADVGILDAVLFLGAWTLSTEGGGFGETPQESNDGEEGWLIYLQTFALLSATSTSPLTRLLAHYLLAQTIHTHPDEAARLAYIKDTLEHCPFESLKGSIVGILKDEISAATSNETPSKPSIFSSSLLLDELSMFLFPNLSGTLDSEADSDAAEEAKWEWFIDNYPVIMATANLWLFLLMREYQGQKGVCGIQLWGERIEERWSGKLRAWLDEVAADEEVQDLVKKRGLDTDIDIVKSVLDRVDEVRKQVNA